LPRVSFSGFSFMTLYFLINVYRSRRRAKRTAAMGVLLENFWAWDTPETIE
jgi:hypothetical protein